MSFSDLPPRYALWRRLRKSLMHDATREALTAALREHSDKAAQRACVLAVIQAREKRKFASTRVGVMHKLDTIMVYLERLLSPSLPWELRTSEKGLGLYVKGGCTLDLHTFITQLGKAEVVQLTDEQWNRESADPEQHCLIMSCGKTGVVVGPVALLNKPCTRCAPHLVLCNLPTVSAFARLKQSIRVTQNVAEQQQQIAVNEQQQQHQQHQQLVPATRSSGHCILSESSIEAAEAGSRADLMSAARKRKARASSSTVLSRDRLLPQMSLRVHSSYKSKSVRLSAGEEILLGYGRAYGVFRSRSAEGQQT
jgi:DNA-binding protein H-NS